MRIAALRALIIATLITTWSCIGPPENTREARFDSKFPDLDSILEKQVKHLAGKKMEKQVLLDGQMEKVRLIPDSATLAHDLNLFDDIDISKPGYIGEYDLVKEGNVDSFKRINDKGPQWVRVKRNTNGKIESITAQYDETNILFSASRMYLLQFDAAGEQLQSYAFSGYQKLLFKDTVHFDIKGNF